jgi:hypothetical protein
MNLNEVWHYDDYVDRWAAEREFALRRRQYERACEGTLGVLARATKALLEFQQQLAGLNRVLKS